MSGHQECSTIIDMLATYGSIWSTESNRWGAGIIYSSVRPCSRSFFGVFPFRTVCASSMSAPPRLVKALVDMNCDATAVATVVPIPTIVPVAEIIGE